jgi:hypothetical protein
MLYMIEKFEDQYVNNQCTNSISINNACSFDFCGVMHIYLDFNTLSDL